MLMIHVSIPLQISGGIFVHGEFIQMHTINESNYTVIKQPHNGNKGAKQIGKKQFSL